MARARARATAGMAVRKLRRNFSEIAFSVIIATLVLVTGGAAYVNAVRKGWGADAAAWAQATGSIIAVAGAGWLARSESRRSRRRRREQGEEAAQGVRFLIAQAQFEAQVIAAELTRAERPFEISEIGAWVQQ